MRRPRLSIQKRAAAWLMLAGAALLASAAGGEPIRLMSAGDSLTFGMGTESSLGYREAFHRKVTEAGFEVEFVGGEKSGTVQAVQAHEGHPGLTVEGLSARIQKWLRRYKPDVVLLMIGTNDAFDDPLVIQAWEIHFSVVIDRVLSRRDTKLFVSTIPPGQYGRAQRNRELINHTIRTYVGERQKTDADLVLVDIWEKIDEQFDLFDINHPNESGYEKIADAFAEVFLANMTLPEPEPEPEQEPEPQAEAE